MSKSDDKPTVPTWGYHETEEPRVFDLKQGEDLPDGWEDTPAAFEKDDSSEPRKRRGRPPKTAG